MKTRSRWAASLAAVAAMGIGLVASAQEPGAEAANLAALLAAAETGSPRILAARKLAEAAEARVPQAGALADPVLGVGVMNLPVADPSLGRDMMTMTTVQLGEQFPWPGKLGLREEVARLNAEAARWDAERTRQEVLADLKSAYYRIYFLDKALEVTGRNETLVADFARLTSARYGVGAGAQADVLKAQVERTRLTDQLVTLTEQRTSAAARLNALLGRPTAAPIRGAELPRELGAAALDGKPAVATFTSVALDGGKDQTAPGIPSVEALQRLALESNPTLMAHLRRVAARERALVLADKAELPDVSISVAYGHRPSFGDFANLMVSIPLPVFRGRKQNQAVVEVAATLAEHQARQRAIVDEINAEIESLAAGLRRARDQLVLLNEGILPQARTSLSSTTASYQVGRVDFLTLLDAQVTLFRLELDYHRLLADFAADVAALERAVGTEVIR